MGVYFTIEMPYKALERRLHACVAGVPLYGIRDGTLNDAEEARYRAALKFIQRFRHQFHIIDIPRGATMRYIETKYLELIDDNPDDPIRLSVVDYLNLMSMDGEEGPGPDWLKIGKLGEQARRVHTRPWHPDDLAGPVEPAAQGGVRAGRQTGPGPHRPKPDACPERQHGPQHREAQGSRQTCDWPTWTAPAPTPP